MKSSLNALNDAEREALARLYELPGYKALKKLCEAEIASFGKDALLAQEITMVHYLRGRATMAADLPRLIRKLYKEIDQRP